MPVAVEDVRAVEPAHLQAALDDACQLADDGEHVSQPLQDRRKALVERARGLSDAIDRRILAKVGRPLHGSQPASDALAEAILDADTEESVKALEDAFGAAGH